MNKQFPDPHREGERRIVTSQIHNKIVNIRLLIQIVSRSAHLPLKETPTSRFGIRSAHKKIADIKQLTRTRHK